jgi:hypothetical protein
MTGSNPNTPTLPKKSTTTREYYSGHDAPLEGFEASIAPLPDSPEKEKASSSSTEKEHDLGVTSVDEADAAEHEKRERRASDVVLEVGFEFAKEVTELEWKMRKEGKSNEERVNGVDELVTRFERERDARGGA